MTLLKHKRSIFAGLAGLAIVGIGAFVWKSRKKFFDPEDYIS
ncbi:LPXTG cell wall anchor domain-containing protein [Candidatus Parcubacteria bacterium]|nr:MAG: LPXTG cell wall anchor domain-containing protein [Candidatus Parcubacteria bacterium]